jgi:small-conductance mechanosensitive channel
LFFLVQTTSREGKVPNREFFLNDNYINLAIIILLLTDIILTISGYFFPELWFSIFHGTSYNDPEGFLRRCAGNWLMFGVLQAIALWCWKTEPYWLAVVAGARLSDILTDWNYLLFCNNVTPIGWAGLFLAGPINLMFGIYFLKAYSNRNSK